MRQKTKPLDPKDLIGSWRHAHEEDAGDTVVYRRSSYPFPPSRGRHGFELRADGTSVESSIAATDASQQTEGKWSLAPDDCIVLTAGTGKVLRRLCLTSAQPDKLIFRR